MLVGLLGSEASKPNSLLQHVVVLAFALIALAFALVILAVILPILVAIAVLVVVVLMVSLPVLVALIIALIALALISLVLEKSCLLSGVDSNLFYFVCWEYLQQTGVSECRTTVGGSKKRQVCNGGKRQRASDDKFNDTYEFGQQERYAGSEYIEISLYETFAGLSGVIWVCGYGACIRLQVVGSLDLERLMPSPRVPSFFRFPY
ncbi:hypothetical protein CVT25_012951 [Psilocybe cyanescens]|uniref:Uncharacterized protein n=1 Tax=Psilocybe cyanescens TaxID=93625 RepID=A0A409XTD6_PSICY|nr:hypothetical protein CVT25_012951 [Psilocybe cyanescens]